MGTLATTFTDAGIALEQSVKDAYGNLIAGSSTERYGAHGQREADGESNLVHVRRRTMDPTTGRFGQNDPLQWNIPYAHYVYAGNNPVSATDPSGEIIKFKHVPSGMRQQWVGVLGTWLGYNLTLDGDTVQYRGDSGTPMDTGSLPGEFYRMAASTDVYYVEDIVSRIRHHNPNAQAFMSMLLKGDSAALAGLRAFGEHYTSGAAAEDMQNGGATFVRSVNDGIENAKGRLERGELGLLIRDGLAAPALAGKAYGDSLQGMVAGAYSGDYEGTRSAASDLYAAQANIGAQVLLAKFADMGVERMGRGGVVLFGSAEAGAEGILKFIRDRAHLDAHGPWSDPQLADFAKNHIVGRKGIPTVDKNGVPGYVYRGRVAGQDMEAILRPDGSWVSFKPSK